MGSDTPKFVLYEDGQVIQLVKLSESRTAYYWKQLSKHDLALLVSKVKGCGPFPRKVSRIVLSEATDMPETNFFVDLDGVPFVTSVYGLSWSGDGEVPARKPGVNLPKEVRELHNLLASVNFPGSQEWQPKYVEAMVWPYDYAQEASIIWPNDWPSLDSSQAFKRRESYSIFLPGAELPRLTEFLKGRKEKGAVEIDGKKWSVAIRSTFPSEPVWRHAFATRE
jgi:hypothetical protein